LSTPAFSAFERLRFVVLSTLALSVMSMRTVRMSPTRAAR
jgi:hypothetical protein